MSFGRVCVANLAFIAAGEVASVVSVHNMRLGGYYCLFLDLHLLSFVHHVHPDRSLLPQENLLDELHKLCFTIEKHLMLN